MPKGEAARYLMTSPQGLDEMGIRAKMHPRRGPVYDRRDLDAWADTLPYVNDEPTETGWEDVA